MKKIIGWIFIHSPIVLVFGIVLAFGFVGLGIKDMLVFLLVFFGGLGLGGLLFWGCFYLILRGQKMLEQETKETK